MLLVCSQCGKGELFYNWKVFVSFCGGCQKRTKWVTLPAYTREKKKKKRGKNAAIT